MRGIMSIESVYARGTISKHSLSMCGAITCTCVFECNVTVLPPHWSVKNCLFSYLVFVWYAPTSVVFGTVLLLYLLLGVCIFSTGCVEPHELLLWLCGAFVFVFLKWEWLAAMGRTPWAVGSAAVGSHHWQRFRPSTAWEEPLTAGSPGLELSSPAPGTNVPEEPCCNAAKTSPKQCSPALPNSKDVKDVKNEYLERKWGSEHTCQSQVITFAINISLQNETALGVKRIVVALVVVLCGLL